MSDKKNLAPDENSVDENELISRREFFVGLKKWSKVVIGSAIVGSAVANANQEAQAYTWLNRRGGWGNGGGGSWLNRAPWNNWNNWNNRGPSWLNGGGGWINRRGGGGFGWIN